MRKGYNDGGFRKRRIRGRLRGRGKRRAARQSAPARGWEVTGGREGWLCDTSEGAPEILMDRLFLTVRHRSVFIFSVMALCRVSLRYQ